MMIPFGTSKNETYVADLDEVSAAEAKAGTIASNIGTAKAAPAPRKNVRRGSAFLKTIMTNEPSAFEMGRY
jgi:hypothetical protein